MFKPFIKHCLVGMMALLISCSKKEAVVSDNSTATLISYTLIDSLSTSQLNDINTKVLTGFLQTATIKSDAYINRMAKPIYPVKLYRVTYQSAIPEFGRPATATGLIAIPVVPNQQLPLISYQHGTVFDKRMVPSVPSMSYETQFMISQFASQGYVLIGADYFGLGENTTEPNSYFVRNSTEQACLDMYYAALQILEKEKISKTKFFVSGWSQGAYNTMLFLRRLEIERIRVDAAFTAAAPVDPLFFVTRGLFNPRPIDADYTPAALCNLMLSVETYNRLEGLSKQYINPKYYQYARDFYDFKIDYSRFDSLVPKKLNEVFTQAFFDDAKQANTPFWKILNNSEAYKWLSVTPFTAYYGMMDEAVPETIAAYAVEYMRKLGKQDAYQVNAGANADHRDTYIESLISAKPWIDSFR